MRTINEKLLRDLAVYDALPCISLFLDMTAGGGDHRHIGISLKNAKSEAARLVDAAAFADAAAVAAVKDRLEALRYDDVMGGHDRRVAVFIGPDLTEVVAARCDETGAHAGRPKVANGSPENRRHKQEPASRVSVRLASP